MSDEKKQPKEPAPQPLRFELSGGHAPLSFTSPEEFREWVVKQRKRLEWIEQLPRTQPVNDAWAKVKNPLNQMEQLAKRLSEEKVPDNERESMREAIGRSINQVYEARLWTELTDERLAFLETRRAESPDLAGHLLHAWVSDPTWNQGNPSVAQMRAAALATVFDEGLAHKAKAEGESLHRIREEWESFERTARDTFAGLRTEFQEFRKESREQRWREREEFEKILRDGQEKFQEIVSLYDERLALQAPVEYWQKKATRHRERAKLHGWLFGLLLASFVVVFGLEVYFFWDLGADLSAGESLAPWQIVIMVATAVVFAWPLRIFSRLLLSNVHLRSDAEERETMVTTYLSLMREGRAIEEQDRQLILAALFRPSASGVVKDDAMPPTLLGELSRFVSGRH